MNKYYKWFRHLLAIVVFIDIVLGAIVIFFPNSTLRLFGQDPSQDVLWTAFGGLCLLLIGLFIRPATRDPLRYASTARMAVIVKVALALFFLILWPGRYVLFGIVALIFFVILGLLLWLAKREPQPEWRPASA